MIIAVVLWLLAAVGVVVFVVRAWSLRPLTTTGRGKLVRSGVDAVVALAHHGRLGDTEGVDAALEDVDGLVDVLGVGRRLLGALRLEDELRPTPEVEPELRLLVEGQGQAPAEKAEHEEEPDEDTT